MNKKLLCIIMCILLAFCFIGCKEAQEVQEEPPMDLMQKKLSGDYEFAMIGEDGTELLQGDDVTSVHIIYKKGENRYLEIRFTKDGAKKFEDAIEDNDEGLSITLDGEVFVSGVMANEDTPERAKLTGDYKTIMGWFNKIT